MTMSFFIPYAKPTDSTQEFVQTVFKHFGKIDHVDIVKDKQDKHGNSYCALYVHFQFLNKTEYVEKHLQQLKDEGNIRLTFPNNHHFWTVLENNAKKHTLGDRKIRLELLPEPTKPEPMPMLPCFDFDEIEDTKMMMEELESLMEEEDKHLITIDGRYVKILEDEVKVLREAMMFHTAMITRF